MQKAKKVHKAATMDDKRLQSTLKRLNVNTIPGIEEVRAPSPHHRAGPIRYLCWSDAQVNLFKEDNSIIHFENPKGERRATSLACTL
jgi:hypothetical protein